MKIIFSILILLIISFNAHSHELSFQERENTCYRAHATIETFSKMMANYEGQPELAEQFNYQRDTVSKEIVIYNYFKCDEFKPFNHF